jgi:hypothetical protein
VAARVRIRVAVRDLTKAQAGPGVHRETARNGELIEPGVIHLVVADHVHHATRTGAAPKADTNVAMKIRANGATRAPTKNVVHAPPVPVGPDVMVARRPVQRAATLDPVIRADPNPMFDAVLAAPIVTNAMIVQHATVASNDPRTVAPFARRVAAVVTTRTAIVGPVSRRVPSVPVHETARATNDRDVTVLDDLIVERVS